MVYVLLNQVSYNSYFPYWVVLISHNIMARGDRYSSNIYWDVGVIITAIHNSVQNHALSLVRDNAVIDVGYKRDSTTIIYSTNWSRIDKRKQDQFMCQQILQETTG